MNVVREIERINKQELARAASGESGGSWHDQYKDSAYIFVGGLAPQLTEGDVITIFSQYGEPVDINLPRDKQTGKTRGFGFLMYEDQKSTILAVDNLNGAKVLDRTLRVDHVDKYKQLEKGEDGKMKEADSETMNARPELFMNADGDSDSGASEEDEDLYDGIDPDDPMAAYLIQQRKEDRALAIANGTHTTKKKRKKGDKSARKEDKEERRRRREERRAKKAEKSRRDDDGPSSRRRSRSRSPDRRRQERRRDDDSEDERDSRRRSRRSYPREAEDRARAPDAGRSRARRSYTPEEQRTSRRDRDDSQDREYSRRR